MISVEHLSKQYGDQVLFEDLSFTLSSREKLGIVGRNGHGKTTLIKMIAGTETIDEGEILFPKEYRIGYLSQIIEFSEETLLKEGCLALSPDEAEGQWKVEKILSGLGFSVADFSRHPNEFSGGYQMRVNLAKVLISNPHLLLLDEPTNFLDIVSIRWLIQFLKRWPGEIILVSHNREFMDSIVGHVMGFHRGKIDKVKGTTKNYYEKILIEEEIHEKNRLNLEKKRKQTQEYIDKYRAKARRASQVQSRIKGLEKMGTLQKLHKVKDLYFKFNDCPIPPKYSLEARNLSFSYDGQPPFLIENFSLIVSSTDRIGIIGKNGKGKSTLMNLLSGQLTPLSGTVKKHPQCRLAHFVQANTAHLNPQSSVLDEVLSARDDGDKGLARRTCGTMMFSGDRALKKISVLSGGEKCRVLLGKLLGTSANTLFLDEPTHHLDMESTQAMIDAINKFPGSSIVVTHDEHFLRSVANRLIVFQENKIYLYEGSYDEFLDERGWEDEGVAKNKKESNQKLSKKELRKIKAEIAQQRKIMLGPYEEKIESLESDISGFEDELASLNQAMIESSESRNEKKIADLSKQTGALRKKISRMYESLDSVLEKYEEVKNEFESKNSRMGE